jgi:hypothetical protein
MGRARLARLSSRFATIFAWYSLCERGTRAGASETTSGGGEVTNGLDSGVYPDVKRTAGRGRGEARSAVGGASELEFELMRWFWFWLWTTNGL